MAHSFGRFLCIFLISALGVAFFTGIRVCEPDMQKSADVLFDETDLMDVQIISTGGLTDDDIAAIREIEGVETVVGAYSIDVLEHTEGEQNVIRVMSLPSKLNRLKVVEGRLPEKVDECVIDRKLTGFYAQYGIGDKIDIEEDGDGKQLACHSYNIVGIVTSPLYLDFSRGSSKLGSGSVLGYIVIPEADFTQDYYSTVYLSGVGLKEKLSYTKEYDSAVDEIIDRIEDIADVRCAARQTQLRDTADEKIADAEAELNDAKRELDEKLADAHAEIDEKTKELDDAKQKLADAQQEIADKKQELEDGEKEIAENEQKLVDARTELDDSWAEYRSKLRNPVNEVRLQIIDFKQQIKDAKASFEAGRAYMTPEQVAATEAQLAAMDAQLAQAESDYADAFAVVRSTYQKLKKAEKEYEDGAQELADAKVEIEDGRVKLKDAEAEIADHNAEIADGEQKLKEANEELETSETDARAKIADAEEELDKAKKDADELIKTPTWYVLSRDYVTSVSEFGLNANKIGAIGKVFPVIFFLVAILVCLTTMTRMVEEQRIHIGTMKALGYSNFAVAWKYIIYCLLASVLGSAFGAVVGEYILPYCIINAYYILYDNIPYLELGIDVKLSVLAGIISCACTLFATVLASYRATHEKAAELMRPVAPLPGKRVFMENIGFIWKKLNFSMKASVRNLLRYAKRFWMTVIGIGGCMALMLVGFGLHDSIFAIIDNQFYRIMVYDGVISLNTGDEEAVGELKSFVDRNLAIKENLLMHQAATNAGSTGVEKEAYIVVPSKVEHFGDYIYLGDRKSGDTLSLGNYTDGVVLNEKLANLLNVGVGDTIYLTDDDNARLNCKVAAITENYVYNYVYMVPQMYESLFGEAPEYNVLYFNESEGLSKESEDDFARSVLLMDGASGISLSQDSADTIYDMMSSLNFVVYVLVIAAALLAFVVLYNLSNINVNERRRELATLKVLGFYDKEVSAYVYRENIMLTVIGAAIGVVMGIFLHRYVILTAEVDMTFFGRQIKPLSYLYSVVLTFVFAALVNWVMHFKLKRIDMVESLKSIE